MTSLLDRSAGPGSPGARGVEPLRRIGRAAARRWPPLVLFAMVAAVWELWVAAADEPLRYLPPPSEVIDTLAARIGWFLGHAGVTLAEAGIGLLIGGALATLAALAMAESRLADRALLPLAVIIKVTPAVALVPFFVIVFGFTIWAKVILVAITLFYAVLVNAVTGFKAVDDGALEVMESVDASRWEIFLRLRLPNSLPYLFAAAKIGIPLALLGAVFAEIYQSTEGLGNVIRTAGERGNMNTLWAAIYLLALAGLASIGLVTMLERRMLAWHRSRDAQ